VTADLVIRFQSPTALVVAVRDAAGVHDVSRTTGGWSCACGEVACRHLSAAKQLIEEQEPLRGKEEAL
jgi:hypothetical protein